MVARFNPARAAAMEATGVQTSWKIRGFREEDIPGIVALANVVADAHTLDEKLTEDTLRRRITGPRNDPGRQIVVIEGRDVAGVPASMPAGFGQVTYEDDMDQGIRMYYPWVVVHPSVESTDLASALARRLLGIIRTYEQDPTMKRVDKVQVKTWEREEMISQCGLWETLGLHQTRWFWTMARSLHEPVDEPAPVDGVQIRNYERPDDDERVRVAFNSSFSDHWDHHVVEEDDWKHWIGTPITRPDLSWLAEDPRQPERIIGFCISCVNADENRLRGVREGWIELLGTTTDWRRQGLGRALLLHGLHSLKCAGLDTALLEVDSLSLTGANRLYESVGFRTRSRSVQYECDLEEIRP